MNKKLSRIMIMFLISVTVLSVTGTEIQNGTQTPPPIEWTKTFGSAKIDYGNCVRQTSDRGFIIAGAYGRNAFMPWVGYIYLVKTDMSGNEQWHQTHGITNNENVGKSIQQTADGGYIVAGYTGYTYHIDGYVEKTDSEGNIVWSHLFGKFDFYDSCTCIQQTADNGYIVSGWAGSYGTGAGDVWLIKLEANGAEEWNQTFGGIGLDGGDSVRQTADGGYIVCGSTESYSASSDLWIIKTDASGQETWNHTFGGADAEEGNSIHQTNDDGYIITGITTSYGAGNGDAWLIKTDANGYELWNHTFGGSEYDVGNSVQQTTDGGYFITGEYTNPATLVPDVYVIKTDANGGLEWQQILDNNGKEDIGNYGEQTVDNGYIVTGNTGIYQQETVDVWLIKFQGNNSPPNQPSNPSPANNSVDENIVLTLQWTGGDPNNDPVTYDVYFGTTPNPPIVSENLSETSYNPGTLTYNTTYYWKIRATDVYGATTEGSLWSFSTKKQAPALEITRITGNLGVHAVIHNKGIGMANNIAWRITVTGGILRHINKNITGTIVTLGEDRELTVKSGMFFGFGPITVAVSAVCDEVSSPAEKNATGQVLLFWVKINSGT